MPSNPHTPRGNRPKFTPNTPRGTTFKKPPLELFGTTLWEYPSQHYTPEPRAGKPAPLDRKPTPPAGTPDPLGSTPGPRHAGIQGDPNYVGATPSWVIWQLLQRYTEPGERVLDPMCGSGTTLDVCADLDRLGKGFDINPIRPDIERADARALPLPEACCDFVFVDPPYSTHINYSDAPTCIGKLDAGGRDHGRAYYQAMARVIAEIARVLRPGRHMGLYVSDSRRDKQGSPEFMPIGFELFAILRQHFEPVDIVAVVRHNAKLKHPNRREQTIETDSLQRGFNYLFIMRKKA
ncbi:DNA methylase N-4/N-6 domain protein [hydrothermal vent metagenome]|uniref:DNA methylase N-4/N-6 domain protein n=1 Tax=hydrothermal vent metagenome TaxID=652676 RepID=A0A3B1DG01_9ZZZZ